MKLVIFIIGLFLAKDSYSQNKFSFGINYHFDRISWTGTDAGTYNDGYYNPVNSKISLEGTYNSELIGVGTGVSFFNEEYKLRQVSNTDLNSINYKSNNIAIFLNTCLNFRKIKIHYSLLLIMSLSLQLKHQKQLIDLLELLIVIKFMN